MTRLMLVSKETRLVNQLEKHLNDADSEVSGVFPSLKSALEAETDLMPDVIMMDVRLLSDPNDAEDESGQDVSADEFQSPIIYVSPDPVLISPDLKAKAGPCGCLSRPFKTEQIEAALEVAVWKGEVLDEVQALRSQLEPEEESEASEEESELDTEIKSLKLEETVRTLKALLNRKEEEWAEFEHKVVTNVDELVLPFIEKLNETTLDEVQRAYVNIIDDNVRTIILPCAPPRPPKWSKLTPTEIMVANLIKQGRRSREIAAVIGVSRNTVDAYRNRIRSKMGIKNKKANLRTLLSETVE